MAPLAGESRHLIRELPAVEVGASGVEQSMVDYRKRVRHYHEPGDCHELTFSCYDRMPLLSCDEWCRMLAVSLSRATERHGFRLIAFVFMPEHVHLLVYPSGLKGDLPALLKAIKRPYSFRVRQLLEERGSPLLHRLMVHERPGIIRFRYWQEGPGYDRNLDNEESVRASINYIHLNPVRRGLCATEIEWRWSSARWYADSEAPVDPDLPRIDGLPAEFFTSPNGS